MNLFVIHKWMVSHLHLNGNRLILYAVIYQATYDGRWFEGGLKDFQKLMNVSQPTVIEGLRYLLNNRLIQKREIIINKVRYCHYRINEEQI